MIAMISGIEPMGRKKVVKLGRPPKPEGARDARLNVRARLVWIKWVYDFAAFLRIDLATLVDHAMAAYAEAKGFKKPPAR